MSATELCNNLGINQRTASNKARGIKKQLKLVAVDPQWQLPEMMNDNPMDWTLQISGLILDIRQAPQKSQESAFEKGLVPYIPYKYRPPLIQNPLRDNYC